MFSRPRNLEAIIVTINIHSKALLHFVITSTLQFLPTIFKSLGVFYPPRSLGRDEVWRQEFTNIWDLNLMGSMGADTV